MDRRKSIKIMIAAAIAPAFVAKGLMPVKPVIDKFESSDCGITYFDVDFMRRLRDNPAIKGIVPMLPATTMFILEQMEAGRERWNHISDLLTAPDSMSGLFVDKNGPTLFRAGNKTGNPVVCVDYQENENE